MMEAVVIFTDDNAHWLSGLLRPGCRHVFCTVPSPNEDATSVIVNATTQGIEVWPVAGTSRELADHYRKNGLEAWLVPYTPEKRRLIPTTMNNCVGLTKLTVGIRSWALTPWQLRRHLAKEHASWPSTSLYPA